MLQAADNRYFGIMNKASQEQVDIQIRDLIKRMTVSMRLLEHSCDRQTEGEGDRQTDRQTDRQREMLAPATCQGRLCFNNCTCGHTEIEVAEQNCHLTR